MFCKKCGADLPEVAKFCEKCGSSVTASPTYETRSTSASSVSSNIGGSILKTIAMIATGIVALVFIINCFGGAKDYLSWTKQYDNSFFPLLYFIIGFAPLLDMFSFINIGGGKSKLVIPSALVLSIGCPVVFSALKNSFMDNTTNLLLYRLTGTYSSAAWLTIILSIVALVLLISIVVHSSTLGKCCKIELLK